jgi:putative ABC transport system permease protein
VSILTLSFLPFLCLIIVLSDSVWRPLPFPRARELFIAAEGAAIIRDLDNAGASALSSVRQIGLFAAGDAVLVTPNRDTRRIRVAIVSKGFFPALQPSILAGRSPIAAEVGDASDRPLLITESLARQLFGGTAPSLGQKCVINQLPGVVSGVVAAGDMLLPGIDAWMIRHDSKDALSRGAIIYQALLRLEPGASPAIASQQIAAAAQIQASPASKAGAISLQPVGDFMYRHYRASLQTAEWVVIALFAIGLANSAAGYSFELLSSKRELAIKVALGSSTLQLARELILRQQTYAVVSWIAAALLCPIFITALSRFEGLTTNFSHHTGWVAVLLASLPFVLVSATLVAVAQLWIVQRISVLSLIQAGSHNLSGSREGRAFQFGILTVQLTIAATMLIAAGQVIYAYWQIMKVDLGFSSKNILTFDIELPHSPVGRPQTALTNIDAALRQRVPEALTGAINYLPLDQRQSVLLNLHRSAGVQPNLDVAAGFRVIQGNYLQAMGMRLVRGRPFDPSYRVAGACHLLINEMLAEQLGMATSPVGARLDIAGFKANCEVVGVVADIRHFGPRERSMPEFFMPYDEAPSPFMTVVVAGSRFMSPKELASIVHSVSTASISTPVPVASLLSKLLEPEQNHVMTLTSVALLAFLLTQCGLYGLVARSVAANARRIALELALGASGVRVLRSTLAGALACTAVALALGNGLAFALLSHLRGGANAARYGSLAPGSVSAALVVVSALAVYRAVRKILVSEPSEILKWGETG